MWSKVCSSHERWPGPGPGRAGAKSCKPWRRGRPKLISLMIGIKNFAHMMVYIFVCVYFLVCFVRIFICFYVFLCVFCVFLCVFVCFCVFFVFSRAKWPQGDPEGPQRSDPERLKCGKTHVFLCVFECF